MEAVKTSKSSRWVRMFWLAVVLTSCVGCDRVTKAIATRELAETHRRISYLQDTVVIQFAYNSGAFLGLGGKLPEAWRFWLLVVTNGAFLAVFVGLLVANWQMARAKFLACALILAGGIGNLIDRVTQDGLVSDFLNLGIGPLRTGIFNVADVAITAGFCILCFVWWQEERRAKAVQTAGK